MEKVITIPGAILGRVFASPSLADPIAKNEVAIFSQILIASGASLDGLAPPHVTFQDRDWIRLIDCAHKQGLLGLLHDRLKTIAGDQPPPDAGCISLKGERVRNAQRSLAQAAETVHLVSVLEKAGIRVVPFKGCVLSWIAHGNIAARQSGDIDLLVQREDVQKTAEILLKESYVSCQSRRPARQAGLLDDDCEWEFVNPSKHLGVDLHWNFTARNFGLALPMAQFWSRTGAITFCGRKVETFSSEDLILILCVHAVKHYVRRLEWIFTIAALLRKETSLAWAQLLQRAREYGVFSHVAICLELARELYGVPLPNSVHNEIAREQTCFELAVQVIQWMALGQSRTLSDIQQRCFISRTRIGWRAKCRYWWAVTTTPNEKDYWLELPRWLWCSYPVFRLLRLSKELIVPARLSSH